MELQDKEPERRKDTGNALQRYGKSFLHALDGIIYNVENEHNIIIILFAMIIVTAAGIYLHLQPYEWLFIIFICGSILATEMMNSAIEATVDLVTTKENKLAKIAKDTASSATLILCFAALIGGIIIFIPKILMLF